MEKDELVKELDTAVRRSVASWQDIYDMLTTAYTILTAQPSHFSTMVAMLWHRAFAKALEELPEEGDAVNIALKMNHIVVFDLLQDNDTPTRSDVDHLLATLFHAVEAAVAETGPEIAKTDDKKRILH